MRTWVEGAEAQSEGESETYLFAREMAPFDFPSPSNAQVLARLADEAPALALHNEQVRSQSRYCMNYDR